MRRFANPTRRGYQTGNHIFEGGKTSMPAGAIYGGYGDFIGPVTAANSLWLNFR